MAVVQIDKYRNVALVGHGGSGKTTLAEALLFKAGMTNRQGSVADKTSILDATEEEREKLCSTDSALCHLKHGDLHVNLVVAPGEGDFCGPAIASLAAADLAAVVISAASGIQVNTRKMFEKARGFGLGVWIVINHIDAPNLDLPALVEQVQESFGAECIPINLPTGGGKGVLDCFGKESGDVDFMDVADVHTNLIETAVGSDEEMMEKYIGGEITEDEIRKVMGAAVAAGELIPILFTDAKEAIGIGEFLDALKIFCPSPIHAHERLLTVDGKATVVEPTQDGSFVGQVFKVRSDPKTHIKYVSIRGLRGKLTSDQTLKSNSNPKGTRPGQVLRTMGLDQSDEEAGVAGDIFSLAKLDLHIGETVYTDKGGELAVPVFPRPMYSFALVSKSRGDEDKIALALHRFAEEDPCFTMDRTEAGEQIISGMGDNQLRTYLSRMTKQYKLEVETKPPRIPYRETMTRKSENIEYTHKKQSGGAGQFGRVIINVLPAERGEGYEFLDKIFGGAIDQAFRPSVDKGVRAQMAEGVLAGYPVVDVKVELIDGKTHPVDSKDIAFQIAGRQAFKEGFMKGKPVLLEPIVKIEVTAPADKVGDIQGDLASRRGRPQGQDMLPGNMAMIKALIPLAEVADYNSRLSSITGGQGSYSLEESHYEAVPGNVQQQIIDAAKKEQEEASGH
jgi:elongation factor G